MAGRGSIVGIRLAGATVTMTGLMLGWKGKKTVVHCNVNILESKKNIIQESRTVVESWSWMTRDRKVFKQCSHCFFPTLIDPKIDLMSYLTCPKFLWHQPYHVCRECQKNSQSLFCNTTMKIVLLLGKVFSWGNGHKTHFKRNISYCFYDRWN